MAVEEPFSEDPDMHDVYVVDDQGTEYYAGETSNCWSDRRTGGIPRLDDHRVRQPNAKATQ